MVAVVKPLQREQKEDSPTGAASSVRCVFGNGSGFSSSGSLYRCPLLLLFLLLFFFRLP